MSYGLPPLLAPPVLFLPLWLGTLQDKSPSGLTIANAGTMQWLMQGGRDHIKCSGSGRLTATHAAPIDLTNGTLYVQGLIPTQFANQVFFRKLGTGVRIQLYSSNGSNLVLYDGAQLSAITVALAGHTSVAAAWTGGVEPEFYLSGAGAGTGSLVVNTAGTDQDMQILGDGANACRVPAAFVAVWDYQLPAPQIAEVQAYGDALVTPDLKWPDSGLTTGIPAYRDNIQSARVSLANETSGKLSNTGMGINTGTWKVSEDATGRHYENVVAGQLQRRLLGADAKTTDSFVEEGTATITKNPTNIQIDATAGDKIREVILLSP